MSSLWWPNIQTDIKHVPIDRMMVSARTFANLEFLHENTSILVTINDTFVRLLDHRITETKRFQHISSLDQLATCRASGACGLWLDVERLTSVETSQSNPRLIATTMRQVPKLTPAFTSERPTQANLSLISHKTNNCARKCDNGARCSREDYPMSSV